MGRKLNLGHLSEAECEHILDVVHKDFNIRSHEKERLRGIEADVEAEETKNSLLSRSRVFNERYCICCYSRFFPLINPRVLCDFCRFKVCKTCIEIDRETKERSCKGCLKQRELHEKSNEWFYSSVKKRFKRSGSAKVIRSLYNRRLVDGAVLTGAEGKHIASTGHHQPCSSAVMEGKWKDGKSDREDEEDDEDDRLRGAQGEQLRTDSSIQTEKEGVVEAGTMTVVDEASRFFYCFDGMATVSTEGQELDPEFVTRPHNIRVLEGEPLHVECKVNGTEPLDVLWFCNRNGVQQLDEDDRCEIRRHGDAFSLTMYEMRQDDTREFLCIAVNPVGQCAQGFTVTVDDNAHAELPPTFNNQTSNIEIIPEGSDAVLRCSVSAYPEAKVTWLRNNKTVMQGGRHRMERRIPGEFQYSLVIESVTADDSGCYVAIARNSSGESRLPIQLLIQPNPLESRGSSSCPLYGDESLMDVESSDAELMRIALDLSRAQGRFTTTATRMLRSADTMSSLQSQLDAMDRTLEGLEVQVLDVLSDADDDDDDDISNDEDSLNNNDNRCSWSRLTNENDDMKSSAEAVGMVTSAVLQLLSSAEEIAMETMSERKMQTVEQDKGEEEREEEEEEEEEEEDAGTEEEEEEEDEDCVCADDLDLSYQEQERLFKAGLISRSELKRRLIQRSSIKVIRSYLRQSASANDDVAHGDQSEDSVMETSVDSLETEPEVHHHRNRRGRERESATISVSSGSSSGHGKRRAVEGNGQEETHKKETEVLKETELQIYLTSGKVFSLEDYIRELERKVVEVDECTQVETISSLENSVARAVAQVTQSDNEVNEIERQVERWMERSDNRATRRGNNRFTQEQHKQRLMQLAMTSSSPDNHQTESVALATTPDAENNTTTSIIG